MKKFIKSGLNNELYTVSIRSKTFAVTKDVFTEELEKCLQKKPRIKCSLGGLELFNSERLLRNHSKKDYFNIMDILKRIFEKTEIINNQVITIPKEPFEVLKNEEVNTLGDEITYVAEVRGGFKDYDLSVHFVEDNYLTISVRDFYERIIPVKNCQNQEVKWHLNNGVLEAVLKKKIINQ